MRQVRVAPSADTAAAVRRDVVGAPAGLNGAAEFLPVVQRKEKISRRMTFAAVTHGFDEVGAPIPLGTAIDVGFITPVRVEKCRPNAHEAALIEWKYQCIFWVRRRNR